MKKSLMHLLKFSLTTLLFFLININSSSALVIEKRIDDSQQEQQAQKIFKKIRCLVCQGQAISGSDTEFAISIKQVIRKKIIAGYSEDQIIRDLTDNFGEQILVSSDFNKTSEKSLITLMIIFAIILLYIFAKNFKWQN